MRKMSFNAFQSALRDQGVSAREHFAVVCPLCKTVQSIFDLQKAGADEPVDQYLGFSCVGRWTGAGPAREKPDGNPCNWMVRGFLKLHQCEVVDHNGDSHAVFEPATPEQARAHEAENLAGAQNGNKAI